GCDRHPASFPTRRSSRSATGIEFCGVGISGGEAGALHGASLMVGGTSAAWQRLRPLLEPVAARAEGMAPADDPATAHDAAPVSRSEEHTSELQSRLDLVC